MNSLQLLALLLVLAGIVYQERRTVKTVLVALAGVIFLLSIIGPKLF
jgi:hypothetical protein